MSLDMTSFDAALKQHYTADRVENTVYKDNPFLAMVPKYEKFGGKNLPIPIIYGNPQGRSATFATAVANKGNSLIEDFVLTRAKDYSIASIDNETLKASQGNANAFMEAAVTEIDGAIQAITRSLAISLYGDGTGNLGSIVEVTGTTLTLATGTESDITNFEVGMKIQFNDGSALRDAATRTITDIDRGAGSMTVDSSVHTITGITTLDYVNQEGDFNAKLKGLAAWLPVTAPGTTSFFGVDRTSDVYRLGGVRYDASAVPIEEGLVTGLARCAREGGRPQWCFLNFDHFANLEKALGAKVQYTEHQVGDVGFRGILIHGPRGAVKVIPDQNCPAAYAYLIDPGCVKLYSLGKAPQILDSDGLKMLREASADAVEVRVGYYAQLGFRAPGFNAVVKLQ
jgi:hypothetical protein